MRRILGELVHYVYERNRKPKVIEVCPCCDRTLDHIKMIRPRKVGVVVACKFEDETGIAVKKGKLGIGWSKCNPDDKFCREKALQIARQRAMQDADGTLMVNYNCPRSMIHSVINMKLRAQRYFKDLFPVLAEMMDERKREKSDLERSVIGCPSFQSPPDYIDLNRVTLTLGCTCSACRGEAKDSACHNEDNCIECGRFREIYCSNMCSECYLKAAKTH